MSTPNSTEKGTKFPWKSKPPRFLTSLEKLTLPIEQLFNKLGGSQKLNIFYHTDTLSAFLWLIVGISGLYVTLFYQFDYTGSYESVAKMDSQLIAHTVRSIHRYASGSAIIITLLHAYRTFFMDRFRGARWLAWVSGIGMLVILWPIGVTGYWMIWDERAKIITETFITFLNRYFNPAGDALALKLIQVSTNDGSWQVMFWFWAIHILLSLLVGLFFWWHIMRLNKAKLFPPQIWMIGTAVALILASAFFPAGMLPQASFNLIPGQIELDPFFLFYFPMELDANGSAANMLWGGILLLIALLTALPWLKRDPKPAPVKISSDACIGCSLCAIDCPYNALEMVEREGEGTKLVALEHPEKCVSCGICVGSCEYDAIEVGELSAKAVKEAAKFLLAQAKEKEEKVKVVFACERHAAHGAHPYIEGMASTHKGEPKILTIPLPCVGAAPPSLLSETYAAGASEVQMVGCPPEDCSQRRGNTWAEERLSRERKPLLRSAFKDAPISFSWQPPDHFKKALEGGKSDDQNALTWKNYAPVFALLVALLAVQILFTNQPYTPYPEPQTKVQLLVHDLPQALGKQLSQFDPNSQVSVKMLVNGDVFIEKVYSVGEISPEGTHLLYEEVSLPPGEYHLEVQIIFEDAIPTKRTVTMRDINLNDRDIYSITLVEPGLTY